MNWGSGGEFWASFLHMGGYGLYVWGSYGVTAVLVAVEIVMLKLRRRDAIAALSGEGDPR
jgi:heme exporter protein D